MVCPDCDFKWVPARSKRLAVCPNCDHLDRKGESLVDMRKRKAKEALLASQLRAKEKQRLNPAKPTKLPRFSEKGAKQAREVAAAKKKVSEDAADGGEFIRCEGCRAYFKGLDRSHKIPLAHSGVLASDPNNLRLFCRQCHDRWESNNAEEMIKLHCFEEDMHYLLDMDPERFWKRFHKLTDEYSLRPTPKLGAIISRLEKLE
jgi:DNA-directed RNA polymerase subunit M/transcription elongation factor TFIIS